MKNNILDAIDLQILNLLQKNGRISIKELGLFRKKPSIKLYIKPEVI